MRANRLFPISFLLIFALFTSAEGKSLEAVSNTVSVSGGVLQSDFNREAVPMSPGIALKTKAGSGSIIVIDPARFERAKMSVMEKSEAKGRRLIGVNVAAPPIGAEMWERLESTEGKKSWRIAISFPGATFLRLHFEGPFAGGETVALVYNEPVREGAKLVRPTKTAASSDFWGPAIEGDFIHIEVLTDSPSLPDLRLDVVSIGFEKLSPGGDKEQWCYFDPSCYPLWDPLKSAVGHMVISNWMGSFMCTGSLVMDTAQTYTPWFLTANHCLNNQREADSLTVTWNFHTDACNGGVPNFGALPDSAGAELVFTNRYFDETLVKLDLPPPAGTAYLGWSTETPTLQDPMTAIHHPGGAYKRISFGNYVNELGAYWEVRYAESPTEGGSSGAPLMNEAQQVIGTLTSGTSFCFFLRGKDQYGKFIGSWQNGLSDILQNGDPPQDDDDVEDDDQADDDEDDDDDDTKDDDDEAPSSDSRGSSDDDDGECCG